MLVIYPIIILLTIHNFHYNHPLFFHQIFILSNALLLLSTYILQNSLNTSTNQSLANANISTKYYSLQYHRVLNYLKLSVISDRFC